MFFTICIKINLDAKGMKCRQGNELVVDIIEKEVLPNYTT